MSEIVTAGLCIIGDEILSGRTPDANLAWLARRLDEQGIRLREVRVVADDHEAIIEAVNALRNRWAYVFTTGGIGPTHDDITAAAIAAAFGVPVQRHPEAVRLLTERIGADRMNEARLKMANMPAGARLIVNAASGAPGFVIGNVMVLAGVPMIMQAMFEAVAPELQGGTVVISRTITIRGAEGDIAEPLGAIQAQFPDISIGSYPVFERGRTGVHLVLRGTDAARLELAADTLGEALAATNVEIVAA